MTCDARLVRPSRETLDRAARELGWAILPKRRGRGVGVSVCRECLLEIHALNPVAFLATTARLAGAIS